MRSDDSHARERERLRTAFFNFREKASALVDQIARDLPGLTVHDITHIDALWEMADLIAGSDITLTPAEGFVLGGAFLLHDSAMSIAAYRGGLNELQHLPRWQDVASSLLAQKLDRAPHNEEIEHLDTEIKREITERILRELHAQQAEKLATISLTESENSDPFFLLEDSDLRALYGRMIGRIAHSHWWPIEQVHQQFAQPMNALGFFPNEWTVDPLKLACLLRGSDACHLDERRAPRFLRVLRKPLGVSRDHWTFQGNLQQPRLQNDRLVYSGIPFSTEQSEAWWLCFDTLRMADKELRQIDSLFADLNKTQFAARAIAGVEDAARMVRFIPTEGWQPVDAQIKVSNTVALIRKLGGRELYGNDLSVPLRELVQNASDAVRARRVLQQLPQTWGDVYIRFGSDEEGLWIEVQDNGVGMSSKVLSGPFLDFGNSFWNSDLSKDEFPGLAAKNFQSTGKYGIGFFSVFMWGDHVRVTTRRFEESYKDTQVLEFSSGLDKRPMLRNADESEYLTDGGTCIRVWLKDLPEFPRLYASESWGGDGRQLSELEIAGAFPTVDVNLYVKAIDDVERRFIQASDWLTIPDAELFARTSLSQTDYATYLYEPIWAKIGESLRLMVNSNGEVVGRVCIIPPMPEFYRNWELDANVIGELTARNHNTGLGCITTVGGLPAGSIGFLAGVLIGKPTRASRDEVVPIVERETLSKWASEQAAIWSQHDLGAVHLLNIASIVHVCGGDTDELPIAFGSCGPINKRQLLVPPADEILVFTEQIADSARDEMPNLSIFRSKYIEEDLAYLHPFALKTDMSIPALGGPVEATWPIDSDAVSNPDLGLQLTFSLAGAVIEAICKAWACGIDQAISLPARYRDLQVREVGIKDSEPILAKVFVLQRPARS